MDTQDVRPAGARPWGPRARRGLVETAWLLLVVAIAALLFLARYDDPRRVASGDSYWYMRQALIFTGVDAGEAARAASRQLCRDINRSLRARRAEPTCRGYRTGGYSPRYVAIFDSRPGYPLFAAPFVATLGLWRGMMAATMVLALLAAALAYLAVWLASGLRSAGVLAVVALFVLPAGFWMSRMLTESGTLAGYLAVVLGATLLLRGRRLGLPVILVALVWLFLVRSASGMAMALILSAAGLLALPGRRPRWPAVTIAAAGLLAVLGWQIAAWTLRLPGLNETIQDFATRHFKQRADVPDPIGWLIGRNLDFWPSRLAAEWAGPAMVVAFLFAAAVLVLRMRPVAALWILTGLTGILMLVAHPVDSEFDRMMAPIWLPVACAFGYAAALATGRWPATPGPAAPVPPGAESPVPAPPAAASPAPAPPAAASPEAASPAAGRPPAIPRQGAARRRRPEAGAPLRAPR
ncbi:hypothetical protein GCM10020358_28730 [Amorphoplanes nipponensis]|uniref:Uncharacterized protein n=1 Tax=Actinoplanes nipponensis TaxID=135950 RepID=A0A919JH49_9ACTN|nr:hypothetical protein [Actinoplanes nipponensis]GIE50411.1 hypothetical protein Ani05nite_39450 [Actinoplanes nipponensis]